jgi:hypothetical protein
MATPRKRKKTSRDAYIRTWSAPEDKSEVDEEEEEELPSGSLIGAEKRKERAGLRVAQPPSRLLERGDDDAPPRPGGQSSEIHSSTVLQAMELRIDSISEALHEVEKRQAALERRVEETVSAARNVSSLTSPMPAAVSPAPSPSSFADEPFLRRGPTPAPPPSATTIQPMMPPPPRPRRWPIWFFALILGAAATFFATYMGIGDEIVRVSVRDLTTGKAPKIDPELILDSINRITIGIGLGVMILIGGLITLIRGARYRRRLEEGHR